MACDSIHHRHHDVAPIHVEHVVARQQNLAQASKDRHTFDIEWVGRQSMEPADRCMHSHRRIHLNWNIKKKLKVSKIALEFDQTIF